MLMVVSGYAQDGMPAAKQDQAAAARSAAGCGPSNVEFDVKTDKQQHPVSQPEPGKALVYFLHVESQDGGILNKGWVTSRVGIDGGWVGANHVLFFSFGRSRRACCVCRLAVEPQDLLQAKCSGEFPRGGREGLLHSHDHHGNHATPQNTGYETRTHRQRRRSTPDLIIGTQRRAC